MEINVYSFDYIESDAREIEIFAGQQFKTEANKEKCYRYLIKVGEKGLKAKLNRAVKNESKLMLMKNDARNIVHEANKGIDDNIKNRIDTLKRKEAKFIF